MGRGRGQGGARGGGKSSRGRGHKPKKHVLTRKESTHLCQFGEKHPSEDMQHFDPKKFKSDYSQRGARGGEFKRGRQVPVESSDTESEDESTPYTELLGIFTGQKKNKEIRVDSESDEEPGSDNKEEETKSESESEESEDGKDTLDLNRKGEDIEEEGMSEEIKKPGALDEDNNVNSGDEGERQVEPDLSDETVIEEAELDPELDDDTNKSSSLVDPFLLHFEREMSDHLKKVVQESKLYTHQREYQWPIIGRFHYFGITKENESSSEMVEDNSNRTEDIDLSAVKISRVVVIPQPPSDSPVSSSCSTILESFFIKVQLREIIPVANKICLEVSSYSIPLTPLQSEILALISQYYDLYFPQRSSQNADEIRLSYCIHAANHILKTRTRIIHHNARMAEKVEVPEEFRDQGFVRPKILILTPFKQSALKIVMTLVSLILPKDGSVQNKKRFLNEYGGESLFMPKTNPKPEDYMTTFAGNVDDNFKIGLAATKKSIKLYTGFYSSDIIVASPLGLRLIVGAEGEKSREFDFLSSVEILIMDQADVFLMQNWDHILHLMRHLHLQPVTTHGADFGRIRPWALDSLTKNYCQSLVFSSINCPEHNGLFSRYFKNYAGLIKVGNSILKGTISQITVQLPQVFQQFHCTTFQEASDARFKYFVEKVLPNFTAKLMSHTLVFVSSYFDFVRLRNYFKREKIGFVQICEYTKDKKIARARDYFFHGQSHFILYTERAHFFKRFRLKGIGHIIFYQLPYYSNFYSEICNLIQEECQIRRVRQRRNSSVNVIYCKYDASRLAPIVGTNRANYMLASDKIVHAFVSSEGES